MRLRLLSALVLAGMARAFVPHEAAAGPMRVVAPPISGMEQVYYYHATTIRTTTTAGIIRIDTMGLTIGTGLIPTATIAITE